MKSTKSEEENFKNERKKPAEKIIQNIRRIDKKIELNVREFIDWLEEEKNKVY